MDSINQKANELALTKQQKAVNEAQQEASQVQADTDKLVQETAADANAYTITAKAQAEAEAIAKIAAAAQAAGMTYEEYLATITWNGQLPYVIGSNGATPFINIPTTGTQNGTE